MDNIMDNIWSKKYMVVITEEDERYENDEVSLDFFADAPWEGKLNSLGFGDTAEQLMGSGQEEGLFCQLYNWQNGDRISYGWFTLDDLKEALAEYEGKQTSEN